MRDYLDVPFQIKAVSEDGLFSGYGSVFGVVDSYKEVVSPGAFAESLKGRMPALLWQHRWAEPIGIYTKVKEDAVGLHVEGKLALKTSRGAEAYELLKIGAVTGLSIGFVSREDSYDKVTGIRTLKKVDLWEVSPVTFPANDASRVTGVKALGQIKSIRGVEAYLRDSGGFSKSEALALIASIKSFHGRSDSDEMGELAAAIKRNTALFTNS
jgi:HK97 family phage prohead protease